MAIFKSMLLKLLEQHYQIYVVLFYYGLIIIITGISDLRGGSWSVVGLIHFDCSAEECSCFAWVDNNLPCASYDCLKLKKTRLVFVFVFFTDICTISLNYQLCWPVMEILETSLFSIVLSFQEKIDHEWKTLLLLLPLWLYTSSFIFVRLET